MLRGFYRYSALLAVFVVSTLIAISYTRLPDNTSLRSISDLGIYESSQPLFSSALIIGAILSLVFLHYYIDKTFKTDQGFVAFYTLAVVSQIVATLVPIGAGDTSDILHWTAALALALALEGIMYRFAINQSNKVPTEIRSQVSLTVFWLLLALNIYAVFFLASFAVPQLMVMLVFVYWVIRVTFIRPT